MKRVLLLALVASAMSGCVIPLGSGRQIGFMMRWVNLTVVHECTDRVKLYQGQKMVGDLAGATPGEVGLYPANSFDDEVLVTAQSFDQAGRVVGTNTSSFRLDSPTSSWTWIISDRWGSGGFGRNIVRSQCPRW
jgi:hypothetical protein